MNIHTLKKRREFVSVANEGVKCVESGMVVQRRVASDKNSQVKVGFTVTKKQGNAVVRNRIKRRLRSVFRDVSSDLDMSGYEYVLIGRRSAVVRPYGLLKKDLERSIERLDS